MKALSLWQPWATLIAIGAKKIETRSWHTSYRGPLLICSAKRKPDGMDKWLMTTNPHFRRVLQPLSEATIDPLPLGQVVCIANLVSCQPVEWLQRTEPALLTEQELTFGNFEAGRYGWILEDVQRIYGPFSIRGAQGLFDVPAEVEAEVRRKVEVRR